MIWPCRVWKPTNKDNLSNILMYHIMPKNNLDNANVFVFREKLCECWNQHFVLRLFYAFFCFCSFLFVLLCYLSCAWSWEWSRALSFGRHLCAVDHDSVRVLLCASLQYKLYLFPLPVSRLLEGAPNPPPKALQEGRSGCWGGGQLCGGKRHNFRGRTVQTQPWLLF